MQFILSKSRQIHNIFCLLDVLELEILIPLFTLQPDCIIFRAYK